jgi:hypothetical protein
MLKTEFNLKGRAVNKKYKDQRYLMFIKNQRRLLQSYIYSCVDPHNPHLNASLG